MKILLEVNDSKVSYLLELLKKFSFISSTTCLEDELSAQEKKAIEEGIDSINEVGGLSQTEVDKHLKNKFPQYF